MTGWPSIQDYNKALLSDKNNLRLSGLEDVALERNSLGLPNVLSGGFAYVYQLSASSGKKALRLFHSVSQERLPYLQEAYSLLGTLRNDGDGLSKHLVQARWIPFCLRVPVGDRDWVPGVLMDWVQAPTLGAWLEQQYKNSAALQRLRYGLKKLQETLEARSLIHGDIQTGNLAIQDDGLVLLLDYDGLQKAGPEYRFWEQGHIHFQHPDAFGSAGMGTTAGSSAPADLSRIRAVDRFPFIVIDLGLALLAAKPALFDQFCQGENIVFTADDFIDPRSSDAIAALGTVPELEGARSAFVSICEGPASAVPSLGDFYAACGMVLTEDGAFSRGPLQFVIEQPWERNRLNLGKARPAERASKQAKPAYRGVYPVYDAHKFPPVLDAPMGEKIELIGQINTVKYGKTKYDDPFIFINFTDWREYGIKLIFWSEDIEVCKHKLPSNEWIGKWVSALGLVDEPYFNKKYFTMQYSITIHNPSQIRFISESEAYRRIGYQIEGPVLAEGRKPSNAELLGQLGKPAAPTTPVRSTNRPVLPPSVSQVPPPATQHARPPSRESSGCLKYVIAIIAFMLFYYVATR